MIISKYIFVFLISFLVTLGSILFIRPLAKRLEIVDRPSKRKIHIGNIPMIGGVCIFVGVLTSTILDLRENNILMALIISSLFILILGFIDDCYPLPVIFRIVIQFTIVTLMVWYTELRFETFGNSFGFPKQISLGFLSYPFTVIGIVFVTNSFNLMDGADGVSSSLTFLAIIGIHIVEIFFSGLNININIVSLALAGSLIPFIWFNVLKSSKNKIFLGDSGSLFLGYIIACLLLYQTKTNNSVSPTIALWIVAIPIFDVIAVIIYRLSRSHSLFTPDRSHVHYFLQRLGLSKSKVLFSITGLGALLLFTGITIEYTTRFFSFPIFLLLLFVYVWLRVFSKYSKFNR